MDIIISIVICFLSVYGIFQLLYNIACKMPKPPKTAKINSHRVVVADDNSNWIEGYVRVMAMQEEEERLFIINKSENAEMTEILDILSAEFSFVEPVSAEEYIKYMQHNA